MLTFSDSVRLLYSMPRRSGWSCYVFNAPSAASAITKSVTWPRRPKSLAWPASRSMGRQIRVECWEKGEGAQARFRINHRPEARFVAVLEIG
jgi:hypothetical protein